MLRQHSSGRHGGRRRVHLRVIVYGFGSCAWRDELAFCVYLHSRFRLSEHTQSHRLLHLQCCEPVFPLHQFYNDITIIGVDTQ